MLPLCISNVRAVKKKNLGAPLSAGNVFLEGDDALRIQHCRFVLASPVLGDRHFIEKLFYV